MPFTIIDSSIQLRPWTGSSSIWRRSTLPDTDADLVSTSGVSPVTVTDSWSVATCMVNGTVVLPDQQLEVRDDDRGKSGELRLDFVAAGGNARNPEFPALVGHRGEAAAGLERRRRHRCARQHRLGVVHDGTGNRAFLAKAPAGQRTNAVRIQLASRFIGSPQLQIGQCHDNERPR